jgi:hypothetical protein
VVRRRRTTSAPKLPDGLTKEEMRKIFLSRAANIVQMKGIPQALVICADETGMYLTPSPNETLDIKGAKNVEVQFCGSWKSACLGLPCVATICSHVAPVQTTNAKSRP